MEVEKPNYYGIIPAEVRYDKELNANAKLLYSEITCLSSKEGYCYASNNYFAELYGVDPSTVSRWVNQLAEKGYINHEYIYNGKECKERRIAINQYVLQKRQKGIAKTSKGYCKNVKDNNTRDNNTSINIINTESEKKEPKHKYGEYQNVLLTDEEFKRLYNEKGEEETKKAIEFLSAYKVEKNYKTKSDNLTLRRWVFSAISRPKTYTSKNTNFINQHGESNNHDYSKDAGVVDENGMIGF